MPTPYESALMSYLSYEFIEDYEIKDMPYNKNRQETRGTLSWVYKSWLFEENKKFTDYLHNNKWQFLEAKTDEFGYQCVVFINHQTKEIVMAHRGTVLEDHKGALFNIRDDVEVLKGSEGKVPGILLLALYYTVEIVRKRDKKYADYTIHHTGHSLGGLAAECCAANSAQPSTTFPKPSPIPEQEHALRLHMARPRDANAITFDSLGSEHILPKIGCSAANTKIISYLPRPNIANTGNVQAGERRLLCDRQGNSIIAENHNINVTWNSKHPLNIHQEFFNTMDSHSLEKMISAFDPKTGKPFIEKTIKQWPSATNTFIKSTQPVLPKIQVNKDQDFLTTLFTVGSQVYASTEVHRKTSGVTEFYHARTGNVVLEETIINQAAPLPALNFQQQQNNPAAPLSRKDKEFNQF